MRPMLRPGCDVATAGSARCTPSRLPVIHSDEIGGPMPDDELAIRGLVETWIAATQLGDIPKVLSLMADDVVFMTPGQEPFGKAEFAANSQKTKNVRVTATSDIKEITVVGDWAWLRNPMAVTTTPPYRSPTRRARYTPTLMRRQTDGSWAIARAAN